jgi:guanylate kinase
MKAEVKRQKSEDRSQRTEVRSQKSDAAKLTSDVRPVVSVCPLLVVISAPSGAGKTTLCNQLLAARPGMTRAITCTTRDPRPGEKDGVDYYFLDAAAFLRRVQAGNFLEHATVFGNSYGTLKAEVLEKLRQNKDVLLNIDVQGAASVRLAAESDPELKRSLLSIFLTPRTIEILEKRLRRRGTDSEAVIQKRLATARQEIAQWKNFDYLVISESIESDLKSARAIVEAEKMRTARATAPEF